MQVSGELRQCPRLNDQDNVCRGCFNNGCTCSKMIISCRCRFSAVHEECLIEEIKSKPQLVFLSQTHPGYNEYRCNTCNQSLLYRPDFSSSCVSCSSYTVNKTCVWIQFFILQLVLLGTIGIFTCLAIDVPSMIWFWAIFIALTFLFLICSIWNHYKTFQATFYVGNQVQMPQSARNIIQT